MHNFKLAVSALALLFGLMTTNVNAAPQGGPIIPISEKSCNITVNV